MPTCGCRSAGSAPRRQSVPSANEDRLCRTLAPPSSRSHARSVVHGRALAASPGAPLTWVACRQDCGHQMLQRADEVLLAHQDGAVAGMDDVDRASWGCPVGRGDGQDLLDEVFPAASLGEAGGVERPAADAPIPGDLGDHDPHPDQFACIGTRDGVASLAAAGVPQGAAGPLLRTGKSGGSR